MKKILNLAGLCAVVAVSATATPAFAKQGDILVRARAIMVAPNEESGGITPTLPNEKVKVNDTITPEVDFTYMLTDNVGAELIAATSRHTVSGTSGTTGSIGALAKTNALPPTLTLQYHFAPDAKLRPYVGVGVNYTTFFNNDATSKFTAAAGKTTVSMKDSVGLAGQIGFDLPINDNVFINVDAKYIDIDTTATLRTANLGTQTVKVDLDPFVFGVGIGFKY